MRAWVERLASLLVKELRPYGIGHAARFEGLGAEEARPLCAALRKELGSQWDAIVVCRDETSILDHETDASIDSAIERRNDKSRSRLFIMPRELEVEAAASLADTEPRYVADMLRALTDNMIKSLRRDVREFASEALRRVPLDQRFDYLQAVDEEPTLSKLGLELWRIGLVPDAAPILSRVRINRECVKKLTEASTTALSASQRIELLGLTSVTIKTELIRLLQKHQSEKAEVWLREICKCPDLTFDKWELLEERGNLRSLFVHSLIDPSSERPYNWTGLELDSGTLRVKKPSAGKQPKVTIRWETDPRQLDTDLSYDISVESCTPDAAVVLSEQTKHKKGKQQSWSFNPRDIHDVGDTGFLVRVRIRAIGRDVEECSDEFLLTAVASEEAAPSHAAAPTCRSLPDLLLEASRKGLEPRITRKQLLPTADEPMFAAVEVDELLRRRLLVAPVLAAFERRALENPRDANRCTLPLGKKSHWRPQDLTWEATALQRDEFGSKEWWANRKRIFDELRLGAREHGLVEIASLVPVREEIVSYARQYLNALESAVLTGKRDFAERALLIDSLELVDEDGSAAAAVLLSPLHPIRLLWHLGHELLARFWTGLKAEKIQAELPDAGIALEITGSNVPVFLAISDRLLSHADSPLFHWPLYVDVDSTKSHQIVNNVRWALGHSRVEVHAPEQEIAAYRLSSRIGTYLDFHSYVRTLKLNTINVGDGRLILDSIAALSDDVSSSDEETWASQADHDVAYDVRLYGREPAHLVGAYIDECAALYRNGQRINRAIDRLLEPARDGNYLRPHLSWATRGIDVLAGGGIPIDEAHISLVVDYFSSRSGSVQEREVGSLSSASTYGLQWDLVSVYRDSFKDWLWTLNMPDATKLEGHPADRAIGATLAKSQSAVLEAVRSALCLQADVLPGRAVGFDCGESAGIDKVHQASDWVITVDRNLSVEAFDWPTADLDWVRGSSRRYLIDYVPEVVGPAGQQMMISTAWTNEIAGLLDVALRDMGIVCTDFACEAVLDALKSISGKLAMRLAQYDTLAAEAVSLAVVRDFLRGKGELANAFLVPVDEQISMLSRRSEQGEGEGGRRVDLFLVRPPQGRAPARIDLVEVKYRRQIGVATDPNLWRDMHAALEQNRKTFSRLYFPPKPENTLALSLYRRRLSWLLIFYARRALRYGLLDPSVYDVARRWCDSLQRDDVEVVFGERGYIYCPEQDDEEQTVDYSVAGSTLKVIVIGRRALRRYTSLESQESGDGPDEPGATRDIAKRLSTEVSAEAESESKTAPDSSSSPGSGTSQGDETGPGRFSTSARVVLGREFPAGADVVFEPSIRGNPHLLVVGIPGMGKTTTVLNTCVQLADSGVAPFVIDFHGDLASNLRANGRHAAVVFDAAGGLDFNPLDPGSGFRERNDTWVEHYYEVAEIIGDLFPMLGELQIAEIRDTLRDCYIAASFESDLRSARVPSIYEFWKTPTEARSGAARPEENNGPLASRV